MSKYEPLRRHLASLDRTDWTATFAEIERVLGFPLPESATRHRSWWANTGDKMVHQESWVSAGWRVEDPDIATRRVRFVRTRIGGAGTLRPSGPAAGAAPIRAAVAASTRPARPMAFGVRVMAWKTLGAAHRDGEDWVLPRGEPGPALVRFSLETPDGPSTRAVFTDDVAAFLKAVGRSPLSRGARSASEYQTATHLAEATEVAVETVTPDQIFLIRDGTSRRFEPADPAARRFVEAAVELDARLEPPIAKAG